MNLKSLSSEEKTAYLIKPIMKVLQEAGGQLERSEIKERISDSDDQIAEYADMIKTSKKRETHTKNLILNLILPLKTCFLQNC